MINAYMSIDGKQYEWAKWYKDREKVSEYRKIAVEIVSEREMQYNQLLQDFIVNGITKTLRTRYSYPYQPGEYILYRGKFWTIQLVRDEEIQENAAALMIRKPYPRKVLGLVEVRNEINSFCGDSV